VLKVGFEQGGAVSRQEKRGERFVEVLYEVYAPRVIAGIAGLKDNLEDRILALVMVRRRKDEPIARLNRETETEAQRLRDACALACLGRIGDILAAYELAPGLLDQPQVDDRAVDLWAPLLALAMVADAEAGGDRAERILAAARESGEAREADDEGGSAARLIAALQQVAAAHGTMLTATELLEALQARDYGWLRSPRGLAGVLVPLGLVAWQGRKDGRRGRFYVLAADLLADLAIRYNPAGTSPDGATQEAVSFQEPLTSVASPVKSHSYARFRSVDRPALSCTATAWKQRACNAATLVNTSWQKLRGGEGRWAR